MSYRFPYWVSSYRVISRSNPFYSLLPYLMKTIYIIEPRYMFLEDFSKFESLIKKTKGFESIRISDVKQDEYLDYSQSTIPKLILNRFSRVEQEEFQKLIEEFSRENKQKRLFYDLVREAFNIEVSGGGLLWITSHPLGLQVKYVYMDDFLKLDIKRQSEFLMETLDEIDSVFNLMSNAAEPQEDYESEKLSLREIADALDSYEDIDPDSYKKLFDTLTRLGSRVKLNPGKIKLIIKDRYESHKVFIAGIDEEIGMTPLQKSFYFSILMFEGGINITSDLNSGYYETFNDVWVDLYTKLKSCDSSEARQRIDNLCGDQQKLSSEKTRTNKSFKDILKKTYPINYETYLQEFIVKYNRWNVRLMIQLSREEVKGMSVIEEILSGKLIVR